MKFGVIVIGDEILSGRRQDRHLAQVITTLTQRGLGVAWCRVLGDDPEILTANLRQTLTEEGGVFSFGGIGPTPDDITRQCVAAATGQPLVRHPEAVALLEGLFGESAYPLRIRMAELPSGSRLIPNSVNGIPAFSYAHHHFLPGFPSLAWPMLDWLLDNEYSKLWAKPSVQRIVVVLDIYESELIPLMESAIAHYPLLRFSSLPSNTPGLRRIELGVAGIAEQADQGINFLIAGLKEMGINYTYP